MNTQNGFSLLEMLIAVAIVALVSVVFSQVFITTLRTNTQTEIVKEVKQSGDVSMQTMVRMIQNAKTVTCPSSQSLSLVNPDGNTTVFRCNAAGTTMRLASVSGSLTEYLTSDSVTLGGAVCTGSSIQFTCTVTPGLPTTVVISFSLAQSGVSGQQFEKANESFEQTAIMRNTPL